ncbi:MAG: aldo/keto reductase [Ahrensia sp.]
MNTAMQMVDLGHGVPSMSRLIYGVWRLADDSDTSDKAIIAKIEACLEQGLTTFDHADIYGDYSCEALFGRAIKDRQDIKDAMQTITKCDIMLESAKYPDHRVKYYDTSPAHIQRSVEASLSRIGIDVIDLLLIHRPDPFMDHHATGAALDGLIDAGKVRGIGVSNFMPWDVDLLQSAMKYPLLTNQIEISLLAREPFLNGQIAQWQRMGQPLQAWSSLAGGQLFDLSNAATARLTPRMKEIAAQNSVGIDAVALAWLLAHPANIMPVVGTNTIERIKTISDAFKPEIDRQTWHELWSLATGHEVP